MKFLGALGTLLIVGGCSSLPPTFYPLGNFVAPEAPALGQTETTANGHLIYRQKISLGPYAQLTEPVVIPESSLYRRSIEVSTSEPLYRGLWISSESSGVAYCTVNLTARVHNVFGERSELQTCFK